MRNANVIAMLGYFCTAEARCFRRRRTRPGVYELLCHEQVGLFAGRRVRDFTEGGCIQLDPFAYVNQHCVENMPH